MQHLTKPNAANPAKDVAAPTRALHLWHLLSLDAPTVATLWTWFVARTSGIHLPAAALAAMFLSVWMLYAADRLLDARDLFTNPLHTADLEARHLFHHRHATAFLTAILLCAVALAELLRDLAPEALRLYAILGTLLFAWFLLIHARAAASLRLPKELAVGIFFPAAIFIPTIARQPNLRLALLPHAILFAAVCTLNCLCIYAWEHPATQSPAHHATAHWTTRYATRNLNTIAILITLAGLALTAATLHTDRWPISLAASLSALTLLALHKFGCPIHAAVSHDWAFAQRTALPSPPQNHQLERTTQSRVPHLRDSLIVAKVGIAQSTTALPSPPQNHQPERTTQSRVPHLRDSLIVAKVGIVQSTTSLPTSPQKRHFDRRPQAVAEKPASLPQHDPSQSAVAYSHINPITLRAAADLALLTPLLFLAWSTR